MKNFPQNTLEYKFHLYYYFFRKQVEIFPKTINMKCETKYDVCQMETVS